MRLLIYARAQVAVPLYMVLKGGPVPNVALLMGGMTPDIVERQIKQFDDDESGVMIATAAHQFGWRVNKPAMVLFTEDHFANHMQAASRVRDPSELIAPPTPEMLLEMIAREQAQANFIEEKVVGDAYVPRLTSSVEPVELKRHPRFKEGAKLRVQFPYHVEITNWAQVRKPKIVEQIHRDYGGASWIDHVGCRTFGFHNSNIQNNFQKAFGGRKLERIS